MKGLVTDPSTLGSPWFWSLYGRLNPRDKTLTLYPPMELLSALLMVVVGGPLFLAGVRWPAIQVHLFSGQWSADEMVWVGAFLFGFGVLLLGFLSQVRVDARQQWVAFRRFWWGEAQYIPFSQVVGLQFQTTYTALGEQSGLLTLLMRYSEYGHFKRPHWNIVLVDRTGDRRLVMSNYRLNAAQYTLKVLRSLTNFPLLAADAPAPDSPHRLRQKASQGLEVRNDFEVRTLILSPRVSGLLFLLQLCLPPLLLGSGILAFTHPKPDPWVAFGLSPIISLPFLLHFSYPSLCRTVLTLSRQGFRVEVFWSLLRLQSRSVPWDRLVALAPTGPDRHGMIRVPAINFYLKDRKKPLQVGRGWDAETIRHFSNTPAGLFRSVSDPSRQLIRGVPPLSSLGR